MGPGRIALVDEPAIGLFDLALALSASGKMQFEDMGNMSVEEIDELVDHARNLILSGHLSPLLVAGRRAGRTVHVGRVEACLDLVAHHRRDEAPWTEGSAGAAHGGVSPGMAACVCRNLEGRTLDRAYDWLNWYLDGYAGSVVARQGYYMCAPERVRAYLSQAEWDYWYEGLPATEVLNDNAGRPAIRVGEVRWGARAWIARVMWRSGTRPWSKHNYVVRRWGELVGLAATRSRPNRRAS